MQPNQPLTLADHRLLDLVWPNQPLPSGRLCQIAQEQLGWKRTTTYTVLKRLCDKGYLKNEASVVTALVDRATVQRADGQEVLQRSFQGSLPSFLAAFLQAGTVSDQEAEEIAQMLGIKREEVVFALDAILDRCLCMSPSTPTAGTRCA